jgi:hypothetical protein
VYSSTAESKCLLVAARLLIGWCSNEVGHLGSPMKSRTRNSSSSGSVSSDMLFGIRIAQVRRNPHRRLRLADDVSYGPFGFASFR